MHSSSLLDSVETVFLTFTIAEQHDDAPQQHNAGPSQQNASPSQQNAGPSQQNAGLSQQKSDELKVVSEL